MNTDTLFGFLAHRFVAQQENLATEALWYLLDRSEVARSALIRTLRQAHAVLPDSLSFRTQASDKDQAIPDLVGVDSSGNQVLIAEAKFWAGLTGAQPVTYIRRLENIGGGTLAVIAPNARLELLWPTLVRRCEDAGIVVSDADGGPEFRSARIDPGGRLILLSWRSLVGSIHSALELAGEARLSSDALQLQGLCERMDMEAFLPLASEELTGSTGRRMIQFNQLLDDAHGLLTKWQGFDGRGVRASAGSGWYGKYFKMHGFACLLHTNAWQWGSLAFTPLWLRVKGADWKPSPAVAEALEPLRHHHDIEVFSSPDGHDVPLMIPIGEERDAVLRHIMTQLEKVAEALRTYALPESTMGSSLEPPDPIVEGDDDGELSPAVAEEGARRRD